MDIYKVYQNHKNQFDQYANLLIKWNNQINITSITNLSEVEELHFIDSMVLAPQIVSRVGSVSRETLFLDIGAGGGFPSIPLKIIFPEMNLVLIDSVKKKCDFIKAVVRELGLKGVEVRHHFLKGDSVGQFDCVLSRAAFSLSDLFKLSFPNLKPSGKILTLKGEEIEEEISEAKKIIEEKNFKIEVEPYELERSQKKRNCVSVVPRETN